MFAPHFKNKMTDDEWRDVEQNNSFSCEGALAIHTLLWAAMQPAKAQIKKIEKPIHVPFWWDLLRWQTDRHLATNYTQTHQVETKIRKKENQAL